MSIMVVHSIPRGIEVDCFNLRLEPGEALEVAVGIHKNMVTLPIDHFLGKLPTNASLDNLRQEIQKLSLPHNIWEKFRSVLEYVNHQHSDEQLSVNDHRQRICQLAQFALQTLRIPSVICYGRSGLNGQDFAHPWLDVDPGFGESNLVFDPINDILTNVGSFFWQRQCYTQSIETLLKLGQLPLGLEVEYDLKIAGGIRETRGTIILKRKPLEQNERNRMVKLQLSVQTDELSGITIKPIITHPTANLHIQKI